jgi:hypothetical protein
MQKSLQGLLQSLLFQIIRTDLTSVPILCPGRENFSMKPWSVEELLDAFMRLSKLDMANN